MSLPLNEENIRQCCKNKFFGKHLELYKCVESTIDIAKEKIKKNCDLPLILIAEEQITGRGRLNRSWFSPAFKGLWMTIAFPEAASISNFGHYNYLISLVVSTAVETVTGLQVDFKWPNDIFINGKKICGILSENISHRGYYFVVTGFGLNVNINETDFPNGLERKASSLKIEMGRNIDREQLFLEILDALNIYWSNWKSNGIGNIFNKWLEKCITIGKSIEITSSEHNISGTAKSVLADGSLLLVDDNNIEHRIYAGDISYRIEKST